MLDGYHQETSINDYIRITCQFPKIFRLSLKQIEHNDEENCIHLPISKELETLEYFRSTRYKVNYQLFEQVFFNHPALHCLVMMYGDLIGLCKRQREQKEKFNKVYIHCLSLFVHTADGHVRLDNISRLIEWFPHVKLLFISLSSSRLIARAQREIVEKILISYKHQLRCFRLLCTQGSFKLVHSLLNSNEDSRRNWLNRLGVPKDCYLTLQPKNLSLWM